MKPTSPNQHFYQVLGFHPKAILPSVYQLVLRQAASWEQNDFALAKDDWHPDGVLVSPAGEWHVSELAQAMQDFHRDYVDLQITIKNIFVNALQDKIAIEWDWSVTRRSDGVRGTTPDAIIADLNSGKIISWREYFDLSLSVESRT
jgi:ketosteroid isomerase-like protein